MMDSVNKTLYIPLYGKAYVSKRGIILKDIQAEAIWLSEGFPLKGKAKSKWLAYYMGIRSAVFDRWLSEQIETETNPVVLHIGCGLDSRILRVQSRENQWYDVDFPDVISVRQRFFQQTNCYHMIGADIRTPELFDLLPKGETAIVVMEGVSMYLQDVEITSFLRRLAGHYSHVCLLMDCYSELAAKLSKIKNPVNSVGVTQVHGMDDPTLLCKTTGFSFLREHAITPRNMVDQLPALDKRIFRTIYGGRASKKLYRLYEYEYVR